MRKCWCGYKQAPACRGKERVLKMGDENVKEGIRTVKNVAEELSAYIIERAYVRMCKSLRKIGETPNITINTRGEDVLVEHSASQESRLCKSPHL